MPSRRRSPGTRRRRGLATRIGCGVDVVELSRFRQALARGGAAFMRRIFTPHETAYARARRQTTLLHLAGRFAAKEAVIKAVSQVDPGHVPTMGQVEVRNDRLGRPHVVLHDRGGHPARAGSPRKSRSRRRRDDRRRAGIHVHISLSHVDTVAVASAIAIR